MKELQLPVCAFIFSMLLCIVYFSKKRIKSLENKIYTIMLLMNIFDCIIIIIERLLVIDGNIKNVTKAIDLMLQNTNRMDFLILIVISTCLFLYTLLISFPSLKVKFKNIIKIVAFIDASIFIYICLLNVKFISLNNIISVSGGGIIPTFFACGLYILLSIIITIINIKKFNKKYIPIISIIFIFIFLMFIFKYDPYIMVISITITFVNYLMYFTIENPDLKVVNELLRNRELIEKGMEDKSKFLFEMSQDLKMPCKDILSLTDSYDNLENSKAKEDVIRKIRMNANDLIYKTNNILDVSSMDSNNIKIVNSKYDAYLLFNQIKEFTKNAIIKRPIKLNFVISDNVPKTLSGDSVKIKQIMMSLLMNSIKNTESGVIDVNIDAIVRYDVARLVINISDTGKGMSVYKVNQILSRNEDLSETEINKLNKLDVDLRASIKISKLLGGSINIKSEEDKGSLFTLTIDQKCDVKDDISKKLKEYSSDTFGKKRILLVDDNKDEIFKINNILSHYNFDVNISMVGNECVSRIKTGEVYNIIIINDNLRTTTALDVLQKLSKLEKFDIPVIVMLEENKSHYKNDYLDTGFSDYILKNNLNDEFKKVIHKYL